ncbi:hypothetical protein ONZ45_g5195 [Pleurotus djamor]|nr:hypothetical protein ONZ45_g5195 [Pleurotus djamor]
MSNKFINHLTPPGGTAFFKRDKYCTGALPTDPDFVKKGGAIIIVMISHGYLYTFDNSWIRQEFTISYDRKIARHVRTLPISYSGHESSTKALAYDIHFEMDLILYKNRGNETFVFPAQFRESFVTIPDTAASGYEVGNGAVFGLRKEGSIEVDVSHVPLRGLTVLKCYDPKETLKIEFSHKSIHRDGKDSNTLNQTVEIKLSDF